MEYQWDRVTEEELKHLYYEEGKTDREIAERFGVSMGKVAYKRRKYGISIVVFHIEYKKGNQRALTNP